MSFVHLLRTQLSSEIDRVLNDYYSKNGGRGGNRPDVLLLLQNKILDYYPVFIECKGYKDKLVKFDKNGQVENRTAKNEPHFKNISSYAVNGAVHYANALLHHTSYTDIITNRDGDVMIRKIESFLSHKNLPEEKREFIIRTLSNTLLTKNINKVENGESWLKRVFTKIIDDYQNMRLSL